MYYANACVNCSCTYLPPKNSTGAINDDFCSVQGTQNWPSFFVPNAGHLAVSSQPRHRKFASKTKSADAHGLTWGGGGGCESTGTFLIHVENNPCNNINEMLQTITTNFSGLVELTSILV